VSVPPKGLPLPLVSYGGTGLMITSAMLGLVYSVARAWEDQEEPLPLASGEPQAA
jgi:cell division protein FtsW (lipid II flippase)